MRNVATILNRAKRLDRIMDWVITLGGMTIIAAVLGILVFIGEEAFPLFRPARSREAAPGSIGSCMSLAAQEKGAALAALDPTKGLQAYAGGKPIPVPPGGPALPWASATPMDAHGQFAVLDHDGKVAFGKVQWEDGEAGPVPAPEWKGGNPGGAVRLLATRSVASSGVTESLTWRLASLDSQGRLQWAEATEESTAPLAWKPLPDAGAAACAAWSEDGAILFAGTASGKVLALRVGEPSTLEAAADLGEPVTALGFALGHTSLLAGGAKGSLRAFQLIQINDAPQLQELHRFANISGPVAGFMPSLRDKRFLAWGPQALVVDHLTTEKRLFSAQGRDVRAAALSARGDQIFADQGDGSLRTWSLDAPHPEISTGTLWGKVHYESYPKPEYAWQSSGGTDDFEPKLSLIPLVFGTIKGTLYAMIFALPLAILGALYTSQFAHPRLKDIIKPLVEIMAALPSVVLGFVAGLVLAPLFERSASYILVLPGCILLLSILVFPIWRKLPRRFRLGCGTGWEVAWTIPLLLLALLLAVWAGPVFERVCLGGDFRTWLLHGHGMIYDQRNSLVVGFAMGFAVIPIIFTISEDALSAVPRSLTSASLACGASPWQTAWRVVLPTASPGIFSAVMVGLGRAIGETMIVLMATGNTPLLDWSPFNGMRTLAANIAVETPEAPLHGTLYRLLFFTAALLFILTFLLNTAAELVRQRLRKRYESF